MSSIPSRILIRNGQFIKPGDAIVPANLTAQLMRGGIPHQASGGVWGGANANGALSNLSFATNGNYRNWVPSSSSGKSSNAAVKVSADTSQLSDSAKEALDKIQEEVEDIIDQIEHKIYLVEKQHGDPMKIVAYYKLSILKLNNFLNFVCFKPPAGLNFFIGQINLIHIKNYCQAINCTATRYI